MLGKLSYFKSSYYSTQETESGLYLDFLYNFFDLRLSYSKTYYSQNYNQTKRTIQKLLTPFFISTNYIDYTISSSLSFHLPIDLRLKSSISFSKYKTQGYLKSKTFSIDKDFDLIQLTLDYEIDKDEYLDEEVKLYGFFISARLM